VVGKLLGHDRRAGKGGEEAGGLTEGAENRKLVRPIDFRFSFFAFSERIFKPGCVFVNPKLAGEEEVGALTVASRFAIRTGGKAPAVLWAGGV
jgi:hypothetical protein